MIKVAKILTCLCAAVYMFVQLKQGVGIPDVESPCQYFRDMFSKFRDGMHGRCHLVLYLLAFECLALASSVVHNRYLRGRYPFSKGLHSAAVVLRFAVDFVIVGVVVMFTAINLLLSHGGKRFVLMDGSGKAKVLYAADKHK